MAKGGRVGPEEEEAILEALNAGRPVRQVAREFGRSHSTVSRVADRKGLDLDRSRSKKATEAAKTFNSIRRLDTNNKAFIKFEDLLNRCDSATDLRNLAVAYGIFTDKRLLEESGDPTDRGGEIRVLFEKMGEEAGT